MALFCFQLQTIRYLNTFDLLNSYNLFMNAQCERLYSAKYLELEIAERNRSIFVSLTQILFSILYVHFHKNTFPPLASCLLLHNL